VASLLGNATVNSWFRIFNSIYWTLPVVTTVIHFTTLQHINQRLYLLSSVYRTTLPGRQIIFTCLLGSMLNSGLRNSPYSLSISESQSQSYVTTDGQSASLSWCQAFIWGLRQDFHCCQTVAGLLIWGVLSDEGTGLPFTIAAGSRQRSHNWARVPRDSWPYFTLSDLRITQPGGPGPRIYIPQEQGGPVIPQALGSSLSESESYITTVVQSASLSSNKAPIWGLWPDFY
jgi:hypothetical protein